jgi:hypothetical protein
MTKFFFNLNYLRQHIRQGAWKMISVITCTLGIRVYLLSLNTLTCVSSLNVTCNKIAVL